jgi:hypothetical protein
LLTVAVLTACQQQRARANLPLEPLAANWLYCGNIGHSRAEMD